MDVLLASFDTSYIIEGIYPSAGFQDCPCLLLIARQNTRLAAGPYLLPQKTWRLDEAHLFVHT